MSFQQVNAYMIIMMLVLAGCRKDEDATPPVIAVEAPAANTWYDVFDTIYVKAKLSDNKQVSSVNIRLVDESLAPVLASKSFSPSTTTYYLSTSYHLDNVYLETGNYYLRISASDGINEAKEYVAIGIHASDMIPVGIMAIGSTGTAASVVDIVNADLSGSKRLADLPTDLLAADASSLFQQIYLLSASAGLDVVDAGTGNAINWENGADTYTGMNLYGNLVYIFRKNNGISVYDGNGNAVAGIAPDAFYYTVLLYGQDGLLFTKNKKRNGLGDELIVYYQGSSSEKQRTALNMDIVAMGRKSAHEIWLLGNENSVGKMWYYDIDLNVITSWRSLDGGAVSAAVQADDNSFFIATTAGISHYTYSPNSLTNFCSITDALDIAYDPLQSRLLVLQSAGINAYKYPDGGLLQSYSSIYPLTHFGVINNK